MTKTTVVYRDATFSKETRDGLAIALQLISLDENYKGGLAEAALRDVIDRWDANEATEFEAED